MMKRFAGKRVLITAGAKAIGLATALRLLDEGASVLVCDIDARALTQAAASAGDRGHALLTGCFDLADADAAATGLAAAISQLGGIDVLINNAGGSLHTPYRFSEESDADWDRVMRLNLMATVWATRAALPHFMAQRYGRIVMLGSKAGRFGSLIAGPNYAAAKGAIHALARQLAMELGVHGITCNAVCPGVVMTERTIGLWAERRTEAERARVLEEIPLRRHATPEDIAAAIAFYGSDDSAFVTGTLLDVNGGQAMA